MIKRVVDSLPNACPSHLSLLLAAIMLFLGFSLAQAAVPKDQIPVPYSQLAFEGNYRDISGWPAAKTLHSVGIEGSLLYLPNDGACAWPSPDGNVNANVHIILYHDGKWISSPWDYMGICQEEKHYDAIGDIPYPGWKPVRGETYYFFLTTISRDPSGIGEERTNVVKYVWFGPTGYPPPVEPECVGPPVIKSFKATPNPIVSGTAGLLGPDHNVQLSWNISNGDGVKLVAGSGESAETSEHSPVIDGLELLLMKSETFTIYAKNKCTPEAQWPSKTIKVQLQAPLQFLSGLILYNGANVETTGSYGTTANSSFLHGTVNPQNQEAKGFFEFGTTEKYGRQVEVLPKTITGDGKTTINSKIKGLKKGTQYHYRAKAKLRDKVTYGVDRTFMTDDVPKATTVSASPVNAWRATLRGIVNPNGDNTSVRFFYGKTVDQDGKFTGVVHNVGGSALDPMDGSTEQDTSVEVSDLEPNTTYYYKVCATNSVGGPICGGVESFLTFAPPEVVTDEASTVTETTAILNGRVDPNRKDTQVRFQWRTSGGTYSDNGFLYGSPDTLSGDGLQSSILNIDGLTRGSDYYYRIVAWNQYGADYGKEMLFTTDDEPGVVTGNPPDVQDSEKVELKGTVNPNGAETEAGFEIISGECLEGPLIPPGGFNFGADESPIASTVEEQPTKHELTGMTPGATYCYRAWAENGIAGDGEPSWPQRVYGSAVQFSMPAAAGQ